MNYWAIWICASTGILLDIYGSVIEMCSMSIAFLLNINGLDIGIFISKGLLLIICVSHLKMYFYRIPIEYLWIRLWIRIYFYRFLCNIYRLAIGIFVSIGLLLNILVSNLNMYFYRVPIGYLWISHWIMIYFFWGPMKSFWVIHLNIYFYRVPTEYFWVIHLNKYFIWLLLEFSIGFLLDIYGLLICGTLLGY